MSSSVIFPYPVEGIWQLCLPWNRMFWNWLHFCWTVSEITTPWSPWISKSRPWVLTTASVTWATLRSICGFLLRETHRWAAGRSSLPEGTWTQGVPTPVFFFKALLLPLQGFESGSSPQEPLNILGGDPSKGDINCLAARSCFDSPSCNCSFHSSWSCAFNWRPPNFHSLLTD